MKIQRGIVMNQNGIFMSMILVLLLALLIACESSKNSNYDKGKQTYLEIHTDKDTVINTQKVNISAILVNPQYKEDLYNYDWTILNLEIPNSANITFDPTRRTGDYQVTCRAYRGATYIAGNLNLVIIDDPIAAKEREERKRAEERISELQAKLESNFYSYDKFIPLIKDYNFNELKGLHFYENKNFIKATASEIRATSHRVPISKSNIKNLFHALTEYEYFKYPYDEFERHKLEDKHKSILSGKDYYIKARKYYIEFPLSNSHLKEFNFDKKYFELEMYWCLRLIEPGIVLENVDLKRRDIFVQNPTLKPIELSPEFEDIGYTDYFYIYFESANEAEKFKKDSKRMRVNFLINRDPKFDLKEKSYEAKIVSIEIHTGSNGQYVWRHNNWYLVFADQGYGLSPERNSEIYDLF